MSVSLTAEPLKMPNFLFITIVSIFFFFPFLPAVPCSPKNVSVSLVCSNYSALVTWVGTPTAVGYNVTATNQDGHTSHCYTSTTSCEVPYIQCGKTYNIIVTPYSKTCTGNPSSVYNLTAGECRLVIHILTLTFQKIKKKTVLHFSAFLQVFVLPVASTCLKHVWAALSLGLL